MIDYLVAIKCDVYSRWSEKTLLHHLFKKNHEIQYHVDYVQGIEKYQKETK